MKLYRTLPIILLFLSIIVYGQRDSLLIAKPLSQYPQDRIQKDEYGNSFYYDEQQKAKIYEIDGEVVVVMDEIMLFNKPKFNNQLDRNFYYFLNKKLNRVYPLFLTALEQYKDIENELPRLDRNKQRDYIKQRQNDLADKYEIQLRDLTTTEGQVFAKLMYRATGKTVYEIIRELRGGWSAFWWNIKGKAADIELKNAYDPYRYREDLYLESLLQSNWNYGSLQPYPGYKDFKIQK